MLRFLLSCSLTGLLVLGLAASTQAQQVWQSEGHSYRVVDVVSSLENPWSVAFLPDGAMLVTERPGRLRVVRDGVLSDPIEGVPEVRAQGQGGLLEVLAHPDFESNSLIYLTFSKPRNDGAEGTTAIVRGRLDGNRLVDVEEIFEAQAWANTAIHYGSKLAFSSDGYLFATIGERGANPMMLENHPAQNPGNHQGVVIRLNDDGSSPGDNPFVGMADRRPEIWSYGHRSPQGLAIHPETGQVWETEHGPQGGDELNLIERGNNYGWPVIGYDVNYGPDRRPIHESSERAGMEQPVNYWVPSIATSGLMIYTGSQFPEWNGDFFVGGLGGQHIAHLDIESHNVAAIERLVEGIGRIRDIRQGPDGFIYVAIDSADSRIVRLEPVE